MKNNFKEIIVTVCLVVVAVLLLNPFHFWMPDMMVVGMLIVALILFGVLASFVLKESASDEREALHRTLSGRYAFLSGSAVLMLAIVVQGYNHAVDPWLVLALVAMIVVKLATRIWSDSHL